MNAFEAHDQATPIALTIDERAIILGSLEATPKGSPNFVRCSSASSVAAARRARLDDCAASHSGAAVANSGLYVGSREE